MFEIITNWYVNYCSNAMAWCAAHPVVTGIGLILDTTIVVACVSVAAVYAYKTINYLVISKPKV